jgi:hypothetical protein
VVNSTAEADAREEGGVDAMKLDRDIERQSIGGRKRRGLCV